jgi:hypothetical protein
MRSLSFTVLAALLCAVPVPVSAQCTVALKAESERGGQRYELSWDPVPGADTYVLEESTDNFRTVIRKEWVDKAPEALRTTVTYQSTVDMRVKFRLMASQPHGPLVPCSSTTELVFSDDARYRRTMQKSVIPMVGSTPGLNGSQFRTSLRLRAVRDDQRGQLVLRRLNVPGTDRDPSIPYVLARKGDVLQFDDVVAAFGHTGLGSLDIIPDPSAGGGYTVPYAEVRLFNIGPAGTFGTIEAQVQPHAYDDDLPSGGAQGLSFIVPDATLRVNVGARAFGGAIIFISVRRGNTTIGQGLHTPSDDTFIFGSVKDMTGGVDVQPGDVITFSGQGDFVPMYTLTDNRTNDPALFVPPAKLTLDVEKFAIRK